ncbi:MAG: polymer-forming cytoskeletal protein [Acidobacteriota bacterium]
MSIFGSRKDNTPPAQPAAPAKPSRSAAPAPRQPAQAATPAGTATHIARSSKVDGTITGNAQLVIDGKVEGEIRLDSHVVVGPEGRVDGTIRAQSVEVGGKVEGNVHGTDRVQVLASGSLEGDVTAPKVKIDEGAFFKGSVDMSGGSSSKPASGKRSKGGGTAENKRPRDEAGPSKSSAPSGGDTPAESTPSSKPSSNQPVGSGSSGRHGGRR